MQIIKEKKTRYVQRKKISTVDDFHVENNAIEKTGTF